MRDYTPFMYDVSKCINAFHCHVQQIRINKRKYEKRDEWFSSNTDSCESFAFSNWMMHIFFRQDSSGDAFRGHLFESLITPTSYV